MTRSLRTPNTEAASELGGLGHSGAAMTVAVGNGDLIAATEVAATEYPAIIAVLT